MFFIRLFLANKNKKSGVIELVLIEKENLFRYRA